MRQTPFDKIAPIREIRSDRVICELRFIRIPRLQGATSAAETRSVWTGHATKSLPLEAQLARNLMKVKCSGLNQPFQRRLGCIQSLRPVWSAAWCTLRNLNCSVHHFVWEQAEHPAWHHLSLGSGDTSMAGLHTQRNCRIPTMMCSVFSYTGVKPHRSVWLRAYRLFPSRVPWFGWCQGSGPAGRTPRLLCAPCGSR